MLTRHVSTVLAALVLLASGCGGDDEPSAGVERAGNGIDRAFAERMIPHHESAIEMAQVAAERAEGPFVKRLAAEIIKTQKAEIERLRSELATLERAGVKATSLGVAMHEETPPDLAQADDVDQAFLKAMIPHHEDAVAMAKVERDRGADAELSALAEEIVDAQEREIKKMRSHLRDPASHDGEH